MKPSIQTLQPVTKKFGRTTALSEIELALEPGKALGLLGPNGAGKTTLLRVLAGIFRPTKGVVEVLGRNSISLRPQERQQIGYVSENQELPGLMTVRGLHAYLKPLYPTWDATFCERLQRLFELPLDQKIKSFSRGMRMKTAFLCSLAYRPRLLLLDEPFSGLDPVVLSDLLDALVEITQQEEWTMLLSSHDMDHVERLVDDVAILRSSSIVLNESIEGLQARFRRVDFIADGQVFSQATLPASWQRFQNQGRQVSFIDTAFDDGAMQNLIAQNFQEAREIQVQSMSLKDIYVALLRPQSNTTAEVAA